MVTPGEREDGMLENAHTVTSDLAGNPDGSGFGEMTSLLR